MPRFNTPVAPTKVTNLAGGPAYAESPKLELASLVLTSFVANQFYRKSDDTLTRLQELTSQVDPIFAAKLAIFARNEYGMRSISHALAAEVAHATEKVGATWKRSFFRRVVRRPDDVTEITAYFQGKYGTRATSKRGVKMPRAMVRGLGDALSAFDAYQIAKYRGEGRSWKLVDAVNLLHPKATPALTALVKDTLRSTGDNATWEAKLSEAGKAGDEDATEEEKAEAKVEAKAEAWKGLIETRKLGYFALLKNLRNIAQQAPDAIPAACEMLVDEKLIRRSLVLPFRYLTAINELQKVMGMQPLAQAAARAAQLSLANVPAYGPETVVMLDVSGSMTTTKMAGGEMAPADIGCMFAAALCAKGAELVIFDTKATYITTLGLDLVSDTAHLRQVAQHGGGTDFNVAWDLLRKPYERVVILSDMQAWVGHQVPKNAVNRYLARVAPVKTDPKTLDRKREAVNPRIFSFDLQGYGSLQFPEANVYAIAGFSDKVFELMHQLEEDRNALVHRIEAVEL